jgi:hypothetical protein
MKQFFLLILLSFTFTSCDYVMKKRDSMAVKVDTIPELGIAIEKDQNGCVKEAGYQWSIIKDDCIRISDEGYRLNPIDDLANLEPSKSAYVLLNKDELKAEVFLQDLPKSIYFTRKSQKEDFLLNNYKLSLKAGYTLSVNDSIIYRAAETAIKAVVGSDVEEE